MGRPGGTPGAGTEDRQRAVGLEEGLHGRVRAGVSEAGGQSVEPNLPEEQGTPGQTQQGSVIQLETKGNTRTIPDLPVHTTPGRRGGWGG